MACLPAHAGTFQQQVLEQKKELHQVFLEIVDPSLGFPTALGFFLGNIIHYSVFPSRTNSTKRTGA